MERFPTTTVRLVEPCTGPPARRLMALMRTPLPVRLGPNPQHGYDLVPQRGCYEPIVCRRQLMRALQQHSSPNDWPESPAALPDLDRRIRGGEALAAFELTVADVLRERQLPPRPARPQADMQLIGREDLRRVLGVSQWHIYHALDHGLVRCLRSRRGTSPTGQTRYAVVDQHMAYWLQRYRGWRPTPHLAGRQRRALGRNVRIEDGRTEVYVCLEAVRQVAGLMDEAERMRILEAAVDPDESKVAA